MTFREFSKQTIRLVNDYYKSISRLNLGTNPILFPNILLLLNAEEFYGFELMGASPKFIEFESKSSNIMKMQISNINEYYIQSNVNMKIAPLLMCATTNSSISGFYLIPKAVSSEEIDKRFPYLNWEKNTKPVFTGKSNINSAFGFNDEFVNVIFEDMHLINFANNNVRLKYLLFHRLSRSSQSLDSYISLLEEDLKNSFMHGLLGLRSVKDNQTGYIASQFASLFLTRFSKEKMLDDFLNKHDEIIKKYFNTSKLLSQKKLVWHEWNGSEKPKAIIPDLFISRGDGYFDIVDFKLPLLDKKLTSGDQNRRIFTHTPYSGISQLTYYKRYFDFPKNAQYAEEKYGIKIRDPKLWLIVGNYENYNVVEVEQALASHNEFVSIVDYDSLTTFFAKS